MFEEENSYINNNNSSNFFDFIKYAEYEYKQIHEDAQLLFYSLIAFIVPFALSHPQFLVGSVVNMMLVLGAQNLKGYKILALICIPSLSVVASGVLFGGLTKYLVFFIPMIWIGNGIMVLSYKFLRFNNKIHVIISAITGILLKVILLTLTAFIFVKLGFVPSIFLYAMSVVQLLTAITGTIIALSFTKFVLKRFSKSNGTR